MINMKNIKDGEDIDKGYNASKALVMISPLDIYSRAKGNGIKLMKAEAIKIFQDIERYDFDLSDTFWDFIDKEIDEFKNPEEYE